MLVLGRKSYTTDAAQSRITIGKDIVITIVSVDRGKVRVGIETPKGVPIMRSELLTPEDMAKIEQAARGET